MTISEYQDYLRSEHWQQRRKRFLLNHLWCERCELPRWLARIAYDQDLHVHHRNYQRVGAEEDTDLEALCRHCHEKESKGTSSFKKIKRLESVCRRCGIWFGCYDPWEPQCLACQLEFCNELEKSTGENSVVPPLTFPFLPSYDLPVFPIRNPPSERETAQSSLSSTFPQFNLAQPRHERGSEPGRAADQCLQARLSRGEASPAPVINQPKTDEEIRQRRALLKAQAAYLMAKYEQKKAA